MFENYLFLLSRRILMIFIIFKIVLVPMSGAQPLQYSKFNCTMLWNIIASGMPIFISIVLLFEFQYVLKIILVLFYNCQSRALCSLKFKKLIVRVDNISKND